MLIRFAFVSAFAAFSSAAIPPARGGKNNYDNAYGLPTGPNCPMFKCAAPGYCPVPLETPTVNGCPTCPRCPCRCGETCQLNGGSGICQENGECSMNKRMPQCPNSCAAILCGPNTQCEDGKCVPILTGCETVRCTSTTHCVLGKCVPNTYNPPASPCKCGESCTMTTGRLGVCQVNGECAQNIMPPQCDRGCETVRCNADTVCVNGRCVPRPGGAEKCKCGESCTMYGGSQGVCQVNGECAQNILPPQCPTSSCALVFCPPDKMCVDGKCVDNTRGCETVRCTSTTHCVLGKCVPNTYNPPASPCKCGESCTMTTGRLGVCQVNGECAQNIMPPQCDRGCETVRCNADTVCVNGRCVPRPGGEEEVAMCAMDIRPCPDGSFVSRKSPSCAFEQCPEEELTMCPMDIQTCPDGSFVSRKPPSCAFEQCPEEELTMCAMDIQTCPDGSFVSRTPPSCAFEQCPGEELTMCAMDIKTCPDGSTVGRAGPDCAFKPCPKGSCPCGSSCTTPQNTRGFCQKNGNCKAKLPICGRK